MADEYTELKPGQNFRSGPHFTLQVLQKKDGVYPYVRTGEATMVLPWRKIRGILDVCLLKQERVDTEGEILKVCGGYDRERSRDEASLVHLLEKTGFAPDQNKIVWWRKSLGVGSQYEFPIWYGFLKEPRRAAEPTTPGCSAIWMDVTTACKLATARDSYFFDELSTAMLLMLMTNQSEL